MKVEFDAEGDLIISAQDNTERYALAMWFKRHNETRGENGVFALDLNSYQDEE